MGVGAETDTGPRPFERGEESLRLFPTLRCKNKVLPKNKSEPEQQRQLPQCLLTS